MRQDHGLAQDLERLTRGTILEGRAPAVFCAEVAAAFEDLLRRWRREYTELVGSATAAAEPEVRQSYQLRARRMAGDFLIGELARRGFTPAYGFPVDVVSFDHLSGKTDGSDPVLAFGERRGGASRTLDVAIREYAPGAEIVLDGLVHASEGEQPAWAAMADTSGLEDLQTFWECARCRSFGIVRTDLSECPHCQAAAPRLTRVLRPAGFLGRRLPHTGYERLAHAPYETPRISAGGGDWLALPDPVAGRMRSDPAGTVITMSSGSAQSGFPIDVAVPARKMAVHLRHAAQRRERSVAPDRCGHRLAWGVRALEDRSRLEGAARRERRGQQAFLARTRRDDGTPLYPEIEAYLSNLPKLGIPIVLRPVRRRRMGQEALDAVPYLFRTAHDIVKEVREKTGLPDHLTLGACRHGGLTELGDAGVTEQEGMALSMHMTPDAFRLYLKRTRVQRMAGARKRLALRRSAAS